MSSYGDFVSHIAWPEKEDTDRADVSILSHVKIIFLIVNKYIGILASSIHPLGLSTWVHPWEILKHLGFWAWKFD